MEKRGFADLTKTYGRSLRQMFFDRQTVEDKILLFLYKKYEGTVEQNTEWISLVDHFVPESARDVRNGVNNLVNKKIIKMSKKEPKVTL